MRFLESGFGLSLLFDPQPTAWNRTLEDFDENQPPPELDNEVASDVSILQSTNFPQTAIPDQSIAQEVQSAQPWQAGIFPRE